VPALKRCWKTISNYKPVWNL